MTTMARRTSICGPETEPSPGRRRCRNCARRPQLSAAVLEINYLPEDSPEHVASRAAETFKMLEL